MIQKKIGLLLINVGTPTAATPASVRKYLAEFLSDQRVVEIPRALWQPILRSIILPIRSKRSAKLYQKIWTDEGSPLLTIANQQVKRLQACLTEQHPRFSIQVELGMRYGQPSIANALDQLKHWGMERLLVFPLYPQYASATVGSAFDAVSQILRQWRSIPEWRMINHYHDCPAYLDALTHRIQRHWQQCPRGEKILFSFHGLPHRSRTLGDPYYDQCQHTASLLAQQLQLANDDWQVVFQSRFGRTAWLQPYCVTTLQQLAQQGVRRVDVCCPGFSADCLETLEEIAITNQKIFKEMGGKEFCYIPALNDEDEHIACLSHIASQHMAGWLN